MGRVRPLSFKKAIIDRKEWGRIFESSIGAYLVSQSFVHRFEVLYWRGRNDEVDFVLRKKNSIVAIEVKSNMEKKYRFVIKVLLCLGLSIALGFFLLIFVYLLPTERM